MQVCLTPIYDTKCISNELLICPESHLVYTVGIKTPNFKLKGLHVASLPKRATPDSLERLTRLLYKKEGLIREILANPTEDLIDQLAAEVYDQMFFDDKFGDAVEWLETTKDDFLNAWDNWQGTKQDFICMLISLARFTDRVTLEPSEVEVVLDSWLTNR